MYLLINDVHFSSHAQSSSRKIDDLPVTPSNLGQVFVEICLRPHFEVYAKYKES